MYKEIPSFPLVSFGLDLIPLHHKYLSKPHRAQLITNLVPKQTTGNYLMNNLVPN